MLKPYWCGHSIIYNHCLFLLLSNFFLACSSSLILCGFDPCVCYIGFCLQHICLASLHQLLQSLLSVEEEECPLFWIMTPLVCSKFLKTFKNFYTGILHTILSRCMYMEMVRMSKECDTKRLDTTFYLYRILVRLFAQEYSVRGAIIAPLLIM